MSKAKCLNCKHEVITKPNTDKNKTTIEILDEIMDCCESPDYFWI